MPQYAFCYPIHRYDWVWLTFNLANPQPHCVRFWWDPYESRQARANKKQTIHTDRDTQVKNMKCRKFSCVRQKIICTFCILLFGCGLPCANMWNSSALYVRYGVVWRETRKIAWEREPMQHTAMAAPLSAPAAGLKWGDEDAKRMRKRWAWKWFNIFRMHSTHTGAVDGFWLFHFIHIKYEYTSYGLQIEKIAKHHSYLILREPCCDRCRIEFIESG